MCPPIVELLESRRLLSTGLVTQGSPALLDTVSGLTPMAACPVGTSDTLVAYVKSGVVTGVIVDNTGATVVPAFAISTQGQTGNAYGGMASAKDANGNAVLIYPANYTEIYLVRISPTGQIVNAPVLVSNSAASSKPAVAMGSNNSVVVVYDKQTVIDAQGFDSSDQSAFAEVQLNAANTSGNSQLLTRPAVAYNSTSGKFIAAWRVQNYNNTVSTLFAIEDRTFTPAGVLGPDPTVISEPLTATTNNVVDAPVCSADGQFVACTVSNYGVAPNYTYNGCSLDVIPVNGNGAPTSTPTSLLTSPSSGQFQLLGIVPYPGFNVFILNNGTNSGSFNGTSLREAIATVNGSKVADQTLFANPAGGFYGDPVCLNAGCFYESHDSVANTTKVSVQPTTFTAPVVPPPPPVTIVNGTAVATGNNVSITFGANGLVITNGDQTKTIDDPKVLKGLKDLKIFGTGGDDKITLKGPGAKTAPLYSFKSITINSGAGNDTIVVGAGVPAATIIAGDGNDTVVAGNAGDKITAGNGKNLLVGGSGVNRIITGNGDSTVFALGTHDSVTAGNGADTLYAAPGEHISTGTGASTILTDKTTVVSSKGHITRKVITVAGINKALGTLLAKLHIKR